VSEALLALPFGLAIGLLLGSVGGGGSILAVPVLVYVLGQPVREATTVSLLVVAAAAAITGLLGVGGGFLIVPVLVLGLGLPVTIAVGTSLLPIVLTSAAALPTLRAAASTRASRSPSRRRRSAGRWPGGA
jgi:uncharacterized membrane protein YfcA